ncbi:hypothetical protein HK104_009571 [Borealophlyctis nickersoniae]|nr:hypothetical protein HK104_009571 [Borealophlyctis nickersoniae]
MASRASFAVRLFSSSTRALNKAEQPMQSVKEAAKAFKADGKIGSKFTETGSVGGKIDREVGGPFAADGAIGKQFKKDGAVGGTGQRAAEKVEDTARDQQRKGNP